MIIDIHTHTFPDKIAAKTVEALSRVSHSRPFSDGSNAGLIKNMRRCGIDRSVILPVATAPRQVSHVNDAAAAVNEKFRADGLFPSAASTRIIRISGQSLPGSKILV